MKTARIFYSLKTLIPRPTQIILRRILMKWKKKRYKDCWPIDEQAGASPPGWRGWPNQKKFALVLTHDVETAIGQKKCGPLLKMEHHLGFRSSFNFVPERYEDSPSLRRYLVQNGFEVGVHGLNHDGRLYRSRSEFEQRAARINLYLREWQAVGFRSPAMHHNLDWIRTLDIKYDASTFDTDPFEPQPDGVRTIFPFWFAADKGYTGYVELPYTLPQDFTLFVVMQQRDIEIWKQKLDWVAERGGMVLLNTHPDYMNFTEKKPAIDEYPARYYFEFLHYVKQNYRDQYWHVLPKQMADFIESMTTPNRSTKKAMA